MKLLSGILNLIYPLRNKNWKYWKSQCRWWQAWDAKELRPMTPISIATRSLQHSLGYSNGCKATQDWGSSRTVITLELINLGIGSRGCVYLVFTVWKSQSDVAVGDFVFSIRYHGNRVGAWYTYYVSYLVFESSIIHQISILTVASV